MRKIHRRTVALFSCAWLALPVMASQPETVLCHINYGGDSRVVEATLVTTPYRVPAVEVGSYFLFRVVFENQPQDQAAIKTYTYASHARGPVLLHQASFPYPPPTGVIGRYGFTGQHYVYEPLRDGELQYWCEFKK